MDGFDTVKLAAGNARARRVGDVPQSLDGEEFTDRVTF